MNVGDRLAQLLAEHGVQYVFGVPGGQTLPLYGGIMGSGDKVRHVLMRDERSAGYAADAYARVTGKAGVCDATVGPGATNLVSPLAEAYCSSVPVVAIISDISRAWEHRRVRGNASQALRQVDIFQTISKWQVTLTDPGSLDDVVDSLFRVATTGKPGPVVLSVPEDVFSGPYPGAGKSGRTRSSVFPRHRMAPDPEALSQAKEMLSRSRKPALLVGGGAMFSGAYGEVRALAERLGAPVATTISGKGILEDDHPLALGVAGSMGTPVANQILREADLVVFVGTKAGQLATFGWDIPQPGVPTIHIDLDPEEIGKNFDSLALVADARLGVDALLASLDETGGSAWDPAEFSKRRLEWYRDAVDKPQADDEPLKPQVVMDVANRIATDRDLVVCDASLASGWAAAYYRVRKPGRCYLAPRGLAGLGWGAPAAVGACLATGGKRRILHFAGDGGFAFSVQELEVMARLKLPVVTVLFNNDTLAWIKHVQQKRFEGGFISSDFGHVDFATVARGFGARGYSVRTAQELAETLEKEREPQGPAVIDVATDQWESPVLRFSSSGGKSSKS